MCSTDVAWDGGWARRPPPRQAREVAEVGGPRSIRSVIDFDEGVHASGYTAWLEEGEDLRLVTSIAVGADIGLTKVRVVVFVDNEQADIAAEGTPWGPFLTMDVEQSPVSTLHIRQAAEDLSKGAHTVAVAFISWVKGWVLSGWTFTVLKSGVGFEDRPDQREQATEGEWQEFWLTPFLGGESIYGQEFESLTEDQADLPLRMTVQPPDSDLLRECPTARIPFTVIALLDGVQQPLGDFGMFFRGVFPYRSSFEILSELRDLPLDGRPHTLTLLKYEGDGLYTETPSGKELPWRDTLVIDLGSTYWQ